MLAGSTFWFVLPSLPMFLALPVAAPVRSAYSGLRSDGAQRVAGTLVVYALFYLECAEGSGSSCEKRGRPAVGRLTTLDGLRAGIAREQGYLGPSR